MDVIVKPEYKDSDELIVQMWADGVFYKDGLDISKCLRHDLSINLELLQIAIEELMKTGKVVKLYNMADYIAARNLVLNSPQHIEESMFILRYCIAEAQEFSETPDEVLVYYEF